MFDHASSTSYSSDVLFDDLLARLQGEKPRRHDLIAPPCPFEDTWERWLQALFPQMVSAGFGPHHRKFWDWVWAIHLGVRSQPFVAIWPRGGAKSSSSELACVAIGARGVRRYGLYVSETQDLADKHVMSIGGLLESDSIARYYPALGEREVGKYGAAKGWRRNRLSTASGFTIDSVGLDTAVRGIKIEDKRPDFFVIDDVDSVHDSRAATERKITTLTQSLLPAGSTDAVVLAVQNLIHGDSIFSRLAGVSEHPADFLSDRIVEGPYPAIEDMVTHQTDQGRIEITSGRAIWAGQDLQKCQDAIDTYGLKAFLRESQHEVEDTGEGMFAHIEFRQCARAAVPELVRVSVRVDPAVTSTDKSDSHGIVVAGIAEDETMYVLFSWETRATATETLTRAILKAVEHGALEVGVETDQGGDLWETTFDTLLSHYLEDGLELDGARYRHPEGKPVPTFASDKAGSTGASKAERWAAMLPDYEQGRIVHVVGTHRVLEKALRRLPKNKPFDVADALYWAFHDLRDGGPVEAEWW